MAQAEGPASDDPAAKPPGPSAVARRYRAEVREGVAALPEQLRLVGFLSSVAEPSRVYAEYTESGCRDVGIDFELFELPRLELEDAIRAANEDPAVHGIMVYYPVFGNQQDAWLKEVVDPQKDVEGLGSFWIRRLYENVRQVDEETGRKAILPCTPLAIIKILNAIGVYGAGPQPLRGQTVTIFNRSEVVGRPLAAMLANDGARVFSFDVDGPILFYERGRSETAIKRGEALQQSDLVITGVPSKRFPLIEAEELPEGVVALNFSTVRNFSKAARRKARIYVPRVGPVTVAMLLRNTLRLYRNFHKPGRSRGMAP